MILADTSVWAEHLNRTNPDFQEALEAGLILGHPFVLGELICGNLPRRPRAIADLKILPRATVASDAEVLELIETRRLYGTGIGWVDAHLLAAALLSRCSLWTLDKKLRRAADELGIEKIA